MSLMSLLAILGDSRQADDIVPGKWWPKHFSQKSVCSAGTADAMQVCLVLFSKRLKTHKFKKCCITLRRKTVAHQHFKSSGFCWSLFTLGLFKTTFTTENLFFPCYLSEHWLQGKHSFVTFFSGLYAMPPIVTCSFKEMTKPIL